MSQSQSPSPAPLSIPTATPYTIPADWAPALGSHEPGYQMIVPDGLKQAAELVRELLRFNAFVTVTPETDQDAEHAINPAVDDLRTQAELASPGQGELGKRTYGFWQCPDGFIKWGMGIVSDVAEDVVLVLVGPQPPGLDKLREWRKEDMGRVKAKPLTERDSVRGITPALRFQ
ncbi:hypothetical protein BJY00DRAFT_285316 [Aspergillus carlsbadensis]|nr:hypothetical protein BJY00DRAFT_285316 [Aspergillus carlsbadensis]